MGKNLLIVESPAKSKTLQKYLGKDFTILATYGHIRDLPSKQGSVEPAKDFYMHYDLIERNVKHVDKIAQAMKKCDALYLATDPDREGEAISWHLLEHLKSRELLGEKPVHRVVFHEITKSAIQHAVANARDLSMDLVNAQQARRALDYLVGFTLSPLLWRKIRRGLSAGRVQSPALRMIVEREEEIEAFVAKEYWTITAHCQQEKQPFTAKLFEYQGEKLKQFSITTADDANKAQKDLDKQAKGKLTVTKVEKKQRKRNPQAPFITSTLQQEAARKLGFGAQRTMRIAQQLYEGIDVGSGTVGLITYMRTDSVNLANEALEDIRATIKKRYGADMLPPEPRVFKTKTKNAQEAHEAIRPTAASRTPKMIKDSLKPEQYKLYNLIWQRTIACQMIHATINTVGVNLNVSEGNMFRATGSTIADPGFMKVYQEGLDDGKPSPDAEKFLPAMKEGDVVSYEKIEPEQHFTEPPPRYSEASLVKALEEHGIGRPSTYASIIQTLVAREYVTLDNKRFMPTDVGRVVKRFLTSYFTQYVDYDFTAQLEDSLDAISRGETKWVPVLDNFWQPFERLVKEIDSSVSRKDVTQEEIDEKCPKCNSPLAIRLGKRGRFIGCTTYPDCDYTRNVDGDEGEEETVDHDCPECGKQLVIKYGRYGKFIGCSGYPDCRHIEPLEKPKDTGVVCPKCKEANMLERKSRRGKIFFSCARYPDCDYATWNLPLDEPCPQCSWPILTLKTTKTRGNTKLCPQKECGFAEKVEEEE